MSEPRRIKDISTGVKVSTALPNAANTKNTSSIDLGAVTPFPLNSQIHVLVSLSAATGANTKNINTTVQDSADDSSFTAIAGLQVWTNISAGVVYTAATRYVSLPAITRRYVRVSCVGEANGGDASDGTITAQIVGCGG